MLFPFPRLVLTIRPIGAAVGHGNSTTDPMKHRMQCRHVNQPAPVQFSNLVTISNLAILSAERDFNVDFNTVIEKKCTKPGNYK